jgi:hypothetical protein
MFMFRYLSRLQETVARVDGVIGLRGCVDGTREALKAEDYKTAAEHIHRYLSFDHSLIESEGSTYAEGESWWLRTLLRGLSIDRVPFDVHFVSCSCTLPPCAHACCRVLLIHMATLLLCILPPCAHASGHLVLVKMATFVLSLRRGSGELALLCCNLRSSGFGILVF